MRTLEKTQEDSKVKAWDADDNEPEAIMNTTQTFFTIVKGYCESNLLFVPRAFVNGGYIFANVQLVVTSSLMALCAVKLVHIAQEHKIYNYNEIVRRAFGPFGALMLDILLVLSCFCFTVAELIFCAGTLKSLVLGFMGHDNKTDMPYDGVWNKIWTYAAIFIVVFSLLAWVKNIATFRFAFTAINMLTIASAIIISIYSAS